MATTPIPYGRQNITEADIAAVTQVLQSDFLTQGPAVRAFEEAFANYVQATQAIAVANGTAALHLCALALEIQPGQKVLTTPITFAASANAVRYAGGEVEFVDIDPGNLLLDQDKLRDRIAAAPEGTYAGIIPVDFAGYPVNQEALRKIADDFGLWVLEDSCHAPGARFRKSDGSWSAAGSGEFADLAIFSFHPVKHIAAGEGGMVSTRHTALADRIRLLRTHGITKDANLLEENHGGWYYEMLELGYNYRLSDIQAALGHSQLKRAPEGLQRRNAIAERYHRELKGLPLHLPHTPEGVEHAWHLYVVQTEDPEHRKPLYDYLREHKIFAQVHYIPLYRLPYYRRHHPHLRPEDFPAAEAYYRRCLSLPMYPSLTEEQQSRVIEHIRAFFSQKV